MALPNMLHVLLLRALRSGPDFGHHLLARFAALDPELRPGPSTIYPALRRLEADGLATSTQVPQRPDRGGRPRAVYHLTKKGLRRADQLARFLRGLEATAPSSREAA